MDTVITQASVALRQEAPRRKAAWQEHNAVAGLEGAEAADRQLAGMLGNRAMNQNALLEMLPPEALEEVERLDPLDPAHRWVEVDEVPAEMECDAITPESPEAVRTHLASIDLRFHHLAPWQQVRIADKLFARALLATREDRYLSLEAMDASLDNWTTADAAATRAHRQRKEARRQDEATRAWAHDELASLKANPDGRRLAVVKRRLSKADARGIFRQPIAAARDALSARAAEAAEGLVARANQAMDKAMLYEVASAATLAGAMIGADVLALIEPTLEKREAELAAEAAREVERAWARDELAGLKSNPDGRRMAEMMDRLAKAGLTDDLADSLGDARRALRARAMELAQEQRALIRATADEHALDHAVKTARLAGAVIGAEALVMEFISGDVTRRRRHLAHEQARLANARAYQQAEAQRKAQAKARGQTAPAPHPAAERTPSEAETLAAELRARNPRVILDKKCARFQSLSQTEQSAFVAQVLSLQHQIEVCQRKNAPVVIRQKGVGLRIIPAGELQPGMRLIGLDWMARRLEHAGK